MEDPQGGNAEQIDHPSGRTYSGRKATLGVIAAVAVFAYLLNMLGERTAPVTDRRAPVITSITPSP